MYTVASANPNKIKLPFRYISTETTAGTLKDLVQKTYTGPVVGDWQTTLRQITDGLQHLHKKGIIHRDLKPSNIFISFPDGAVEPLMKLANFGVIRHSRTPLWKIAGTKGWMAPEMYTAQEFTSAMDVFTLGCLFGFTFAGVHPFGIEKDERIVRIKQSQPMTLTVQELKNVTGLRAVDVGQLYQLISSMVNAEDSLRPSASEVLKSVFFRRLISVSRTAATEGKLLLFN